MRILVEGIAGIFFIIYGINEALSNWILIGVSELTFEEVKTIIFVVA